MKLGRKQWYTLEEIARWPAPLMLLHPLNRRGYEIRDRWVWCDDNYGACPEISTKAAEPLIKRGLLAIEDGSPKRLHLTKGGAKLLANAVMHGTLPSIVALKQKLADVIDAD